MPTAAKLAAAVLFGLLAWAASSLMKAYFPDGTSLGRFAEINAAVGAALGWRIAGPRGGTGWTAALGYGITATVAMVVAAAFLHSVAIMVRRSLRKLYDGPAEAVMDVFELMIRNAAAYLLHGDVLLVLALGGILAGLLVEWCGRTFR